jgi:hypothetical protein
MSEPEECWINVWRDKVNGHLWYGISSKTRLKSINNAIDLLWWVSGAELVYRLHVIAHHEAMEGKEIPITSRMIKSYPRTF